MRDDAVVPASVYKNTVIPLVEQLLATSDKASIWKAFVALVDAGGDVLPRDYASDAMGQVIRDLEQDYPEGFAFMSNGSVASYTEKVIVAYVATFRRAGAAADEPDEAKSMRILHGN